MTTAERTLSYETGEKLVSFRVQKPPLTTEEFMSLPRPQHPGSGGGIDTSDVVGLHQDGEESVFTFETRDFGSDSIDRYLERVATFLGASIVDPGGDVANNPR